MLWLLLFAPLAGSILCGALHLSALRARRAGAHDEGQRRLASLIGCAAVAVSLALSIQAFVELVRGPATALESSAWSWIDAGTFRVELSLVADRLSSVMLLVITGVGLLIHVYSIGYMAEDPGRAKFFAYLNLFVFAMLILVLASNLLGLFVGCLLYTSPSPRDS